MGSFRVKNIVLRVNFGSLQRPFFLLINHLPGLGLVRPNAINEPGKRYREKLMNKHGKAKSLAILAHRMGRAVYFMLKNKKPFDQDKFLGL